MRLLSLFSGLLLFPGVCLACGGHDDGKVWTKEELDELEAKWGYEVSGEIIEARKVSQ